MPGTVQISDNPDRILPERLVYARGELGMLGTPALCLTRSNASDAPQRTQSIIEFVMLVPRWSFSTPSQRPCVHKYS